MKSPYDIIKSPVMTERSFDNMADKKYTFIVDKDANKTEIKMAVEAIFGVSVDTVNTMNRLGKIKRMGKNVGRRPGYKKAIVKLAPGSKTIEFFEGMS